MKYQDNIKAVAKLQPDYLGFIFHEPSPRNFTGVIPNLPKEIKKVGVFVNQSLGFAIEKIKRHQLNAVQLHGNESPKYCQNLKSLYHSTLDAESDNKDEILNRVQYDTLEIIKVFSVKNEFNFDDLKDYEPACDYFLFDTKGKLPGGNGYTFDWNVLKNYNSAKPYFLSGGIGIEQIENISTFLETEASKLCHALDVNSKFEIEPGLKNIEALEEFKTIIESSY